jgi:hypothetical protein
LHGPTPATTPLNWSIGRQSIVNRSLIGRQSIARRADADRLACTAAPGMLG